MSDNVKRGSQENRFTHLPSKYCTKLPSTQKRHNPQSTTTNHTKEEPTSALQIFDLAPSFKKQQDQLAEPLQWVYQSPWLYWWPYHTSKWVNHPAFDGIRRERESQHQRPFPVKGGTRCQKGCEPRMESTQLTTMYWQYAREMSNHVARSSLAEWKANGIQKQQCCQSCFENNRS